LSSALTLSPSWALFLFFPYTKNHFFCHSTSINPNFSLVLKKIPSTYSFAGIFFLSSNTRIIFASGLFHVLSDKIRASTFALSQAFPIFFAETKKSL
jgi:hypothetical protein